MWRLVLGSILAASILGAVVLAADARTPLPPEKDRWIRAQTAHFTLLSNASERRTLDLGKRLERFRAVLSTFYKKFRVDAPVPTFIYVFRNDASFTPYKQRFNGRPIDMAGMFADNPDGNYITMNGDPGTDPLDIIYHEYTHQFLKNNLHNPPLWFNEGVAECYATFQADDSAAWICSARWFSSSRISPRPTSSTPERSSTRGATPLPRFTCWRRRGRCFPPGRIS